MEQLQCAIDAETESNVVMPKKLLQIAVKHHTEEIQWKTIIANALYMCMANVFVVIG